MVAYVTSFLAPPILNAAVVYVQMVNVISFAEIKLIALVANIAQVTDALSNVLATVNAH